MKFNSYALSCLVASLVSFNSWAGPSVGGGGDVIVLPDDSVVLADPFIDSGAPQPNNMPPLRALNPRILQVINLYAKASVSVAADFSDGKSDINEALAKLATRNNDLRFYGVRNAEELNQFCAPGGRKIYKLPTGAQVQQVACTAGNETFMVEPLFARLSLRDQGLLLIHERLTTLRDQYGGKNYSAIARFTTGLNVFLNLYSEQNKRKYRALSADEQKILTDFYVATEEIEKRNSEVNDDSFQWQAHRLGGGRVHLASIIDDSAFVAIDSVIAKKSEIGANSKVIGFANKLKLPLVVEDNVLVKNLKISYRAKSGNLDEVKPTRNSKIVLGHGTKLEDSEISNITNNLSIGANSAISKSTISAPVSLKIDAAFVMSESYLHADRGTIGRDVSFVNSNISTKEASFGSSTNIEGLSGGFVEKISLEDSASLVKVELKGSHLILRKGAKIEDSSLDVTGVAEFLNNSKVNGTSFSVKNLEVRADALVDASTFILQQTAIVGAQAKLSSATLYGKSIVLSKGVTLNKVKMDAKELATLNEGVRAEKTEVRAVQLEVGANTALLNSNLKVSYLDVKENVELDNVIVAHDYLSAKIAAGQKVKNESVYATTYRDYFPAGYVPSPIDKTILIGEAKGCILLDKAHKKTIKVKFESLNEKKDGIIVTADSTYQGKPNAFKQEWLYDYTNITARILFKTFTRATGSDANLSMIDNNGMFVKADYKRDYLSVNILNDSNCLGDRLRSVLDDYMDKRTGAFLIPSSGIN